MVALTKSNLLPAWQPQIESARTHEEIIAVLRSFGLDAIADRLNYLRQLVEDDPDESSIAIESLRAMALFLMSERQLAAPQIGVTPDGLAQIEWRFPNQRYSGHGVPVLRSDPVRRHLGTSPTRRRTTECQRHVA